MSFLNKIFSIPKKICISIKNSYFRSLRGEENFWIILLGWGVLLYVGSFFVGAVGFIGFTNFATHDDFLRIILLRFWLIIWIWTGILGLILTFIYPAVLSFALIKCAINCGKTYIIVAAIFLILFLRTHYLVATKGLFSLSWGLALSALEAKSAYAWIYEIIGAFSIIILFFYITFKTIKTLSTQK